MPHPLADQFRELIPDNWDGEIDVPLVVRATQIVCLRSPGGVAREEEITGFVAAAVEDYQSRQADSEPE
jgi:hypothetical protein